MCQDTTMTVIYTVIFIVFFMLLAKLFSSWRELKAMEAEKALCAEIRTICLDMTKHYNEHLHTMGHQLALLQNRVDKPDILRKNKKAKK